MLEPLTMQLSHFLGRIRSVISCGLSPPSEVSSRPNVLHHILMLAFCYGDSLCLCKLSLKEGQASRHANISDGLRVQQAPARRAAAAELAGMPPSTPCRSGTLTSSILSHNSLHKASRQLLWSSSRRQTRSCG